MWGTDANNVWAVGESARSSNGTGAFGARSSSGTEDELVGVWGADANNVWVAGVSGSILWRHTYPLRVPIAGSGSGIVRRMPAGNACGSNCTEYGQGVGVTLLATVYPGSSFPGWTGACSGAGPCLLTIDAAKQVTATFTGHSDLVHLPICAREYTWVHIGQGTRVACCVFRVPSRHATRNTQPLAHVRPSVLDGTGLAFSALPARRLCLRGDPVGEEQDNGCTAGPAARQERLRAPRLPRLPLREMEAAQAVHRVGEQTRVLHLARHSPRWQQSWPPRRPGPTCA